jgi:hypothetical protein
MFVTIVFVIFVFPIALSVPTMRIGVPPPVTVSPAIFASLGEVVTGTIGLRTAIAVVLDRFVQPVVGSIDAFLAVVISAQGGDCAQCGKGR